MNDNGFVKIYRSITQCEFWGKPNAVVLFLYLIMTANLTPSYFRGVKLTRGQLVTTINELSQKTGLTVQQTRTALKVLNLTNTLTYESRPQNTIITIINYDKYQNVTRIVTNKQQTSNKPLTNEQQTYYIKEEKEYKKARREEGDETSPTPPPLTEEFLISEYGRENYNAYVVKVSNWKAKRGIPGGADIETVAKWLNQDRGKGKIKIGTECKACNDSSFDVAEVEKLISLKYGGSK